MPPPTTVMLNFCAVDIVCRNVLWTTSQGLKCVRQEIYRCWLQIPGRQATDCVFLQCEVDIS